MPEVPFHLRYTLSRGQRLVPLLKIWGVGCTAFVTVVFVFFCARGFVAAVAADVEGVAVVGGLALGALLLYRGLFAGLQEVVLIRTRSMDVIVEGNAAGILFGKERWYLFLDGITEIRKYRADTWTVRHFNGTVLHIAASAITDEQMEYIKAAMERGRTPEGIRAVIERGKRIEEIMRTKRRL